MSEGFFSNGNKRKTRILLSKLAWGVAVMVLTQVLGNLGQLEDILSPRMLKLIAFGIGLLLTVSKGIEMFFDQTMQMFQNKQIAFDTDTFPKPPPKQEP